MVFIKNVVEKVKVVVNIVLVVIYKLEIKDYFFIIQMAQDLKVINTKVEIKEIEKDFD